MTEENSRIDIDHTVEVGLVDYHTEGNHGLETIL